MKIIHKVSSALLSVYSLIGFLTISQSSQAAITITGTAYNDTSIGLENGANITSGGFAALGFYNTTVTSAIAQSWTSTASFLSGFTVAAVTTTGTTASGPFGMDIGAGTANYPAGYTSLFSVNVDANNGDTSLLNRQFYLLIGNGTSIANSTQIGLVSKSSWIITSNPSAPNPTPYNFDVAEVNGDTSAILFGSFVAGAGSYPLDSVSNQFRLQTVVPNPPLAR